MAGVDPGGEGWRMDNESTQKIYSGHIHREKHSTTICIAINMFISLSSLVD